MVGGFKFNPLAMPNDWLLSRMSSEILEDCICMLPESHKRELRQRWRRISIFSNTAGTYSTKPMRAEVKG